jgi:hypothetical protein
MRKYNFDEYKKKNLSIFIIKRAEIKHTKTVRKRPRHPEEWEAFYILTKAKWERWTEEKKIQKTDERKYLLKI